MVLDSLPVPRVVSGALLASQPLSHQLWEGMKMPFLDLMTLEAWELPWCPVVKYPPANAGDTGSIPGLGTQIPHATGPHNYWTHKPRACAPQRRSHCNEKPVHRS